MEGLDDILDKALEKKELRSIDNDFAREAVIGALKDHQSTYDAWKEKDFDPRASEAKELVKIARRELRDAYGLYFNDPLTADERDSIRDQDSVDLRALMQRHVSTAERLPHYPYLLHHMTSIFGSVDHVLDLGCGYNPLALAEYDVCNQVSMVDISGDELSFISDILDKQRVANSWDIIDLSNPDEFGILKEKGDIDVASCFKLFDNLEAKTKGITETIVDLLLNITEKGIIVSFPNRTISGRNKIEADRTWFHDTINDIEQKDMTIVESLNETFYFIKWKK